MNERIIIDQISILSGYDQQEIDFTGLKQEYNIELNDLLSEGSHGKVYLCTYGSIEAVIKICSKQAKPMIENEIKIYKMLLISKNTIIPKLYSYGLLHYECMDNSNINEQYHFIILERVGISIDLFYDYYNKKISSLLFYWFAKESLKNIRFIHDQSIIHCDIKPDNFAIGTTLFKTSTDQLILYIFDFGISKLIENDEDKIVQSNTKKKNNKTLGTLRYASRNCHINNGVINKFDDLESYLYMMIYLYFSTLPWINFETYPYNEANFRIYETKRDTIVKLVKHMGPIWIAFYKLIENKKFDKYAEDITSFIDLLEEYYNFIQESFIKQ